MAKKESTKTAVIESKPVCGIIMPISAIDGCSSEHWAEVKKILSEAIIDAGYNPTLVSDADDIGIIQKRIIQNLYNNDIVVCDVSGKNPNVMFELGLRLAFDKPAIIVIDDKTDYSFDTSPIEHLPYRRDLRYFDIIKFKEQLSNKIKATVAKDKNDPTYTTFLKNFGEFEVAHVEKKEGSINDVLLSKIDDLSNQVQQLRRNSSPIIINTPRDERIEYKEITRRVSSWIDSFTKEIGIPKKQLIDDDNNERVMLQSYIERRDPYLCQLCGNPKVIQAVIEEILS